MRTRSQKYDNVAPMLYRSLAHIALALFLVGCADKHPAPVSSYQDLPSIKISDVKTNSASYAHVLKAEMDLIYEQDESATKSLEAALREDPKSNYLKTHLAYQYAKRENLTDAVRLLEEVFSNEPNHLDAMFLYARVLAMKGDFDKSKTTFLKILDLNEVKQDPDKRLEVGFILASLYIEKGELIRAEELLKSIIDENPEHLLSYYYLGRVYSEQNRMKEAIVTYEKSVDIDPRFSLGWRALALIHEYFDRSDKAIEAYEKVVALETLNVDARTKLIDLYMKKKNTKKVIEEIQAIKEMYPNVPDVSLRLGLFFYEEKMYAEAEAEFVEAAKKYKNTSYYYYLGLTQYQMKKKELAEKNFSKVEIDSEVYPVSQLALATLNEESGQKEKALKILSRAIEKNPNSVELRVGLANFYIRAHRLDDAKKVLDEGLVISPKEEKLHLSLAEIYERRKQYDDLEKTLRYVLGLYPDSPSALNFLGYSYADRNVRLKEAEDMIQKALKLRPDDAYIQDSLGWVYFRKKDYKRAEEMIRKALSDIPEEPVMLEHLGDVLIKQGRKKDALEAYQKALEFNKEQDKRGNIEQKIKDISH